MVSIYENFRDKSGFSIGSTNKEKRLEDYHPPKAEDSIHHSTTNIIVADHVETINKSKASRKAWGQGTEIFKRLKMTAYPEDIDGLKPVDRVIHRGPIMEFAGFILDSYSLERVVLTEEDPPIAPGNAIDHKGEVFIDTMIWMEISEELISPTESDLKQMKASGVKVVELAGKKYKIKGEPFESQWYWIPS